MSHARTFAIAIGALGLTLAIATERPMTPALAQSMATPNPTTSQIPTAKASTSPGVQPSPNGAPVPSPGASASPSPSPTPTPLYQFAGYTDASHTSLYGASALRFVDGAPDRVFDNQVGHIQPNAVDFSITHNSSGMLGGKVELLGGTDANVIQSYSMSAVQQYSLVQAYLQFTSGLFTFIAGKYNTLAGAEVIESPSNVNFSRSILFGYAVPFTHTGVRVTYSPNSVLSLIGGVNNGWDEFNDPNGAKTIEAGISYTPNKIAGITVQGYTGHDSLSNYNLTSSTANTVSFIPAVTPANGDAGNRSLIDAVATFHAGTPLTFIVNYDLGTQANAPNLNFNLFDPTSQPLQTAVWSGVAGYASYTFPTVPVSFTIRGETFNYAAGYRTGIIQRWSEQTGTLAVSPPNTPLTLRVEYRSDSSTAPVFLQSDGTGSQHQHTIGLEAIVNFHSP